MPTGYTSFILENDDLSFKEFALICAKQFGACFSERDKPLNEPIPEKFESSDYCKKKVDELKKELHVLKGCTDLQLKKLAQKEYIDNVEENEKLISEKRAQFTKYFKMLTDVEKWEPPTADHVNLKDFMIQQLKESIKFDCDFSYLVNKIIIKKTAQEYFEEKRSKLVKDINYYATEYEKEVKRVELRNNWITQLRNSL